MDKPIITSDGDLLAQVVEVEETTDGQRVNMLLGERHNGNPVKAEWGDAWPYLLAVGKDPYAVTRFTLGWIPIDDGAGDTR